jgi:hypothetical protein
MPRKKDIHLKALVDAVESGVPRREIMKRFGFKTPAQVTTYYLDGLVEMGRAKSVMSRQPKAAKTTNTVKVSKRGSISITKEMLKEMGFKEGDSFTVSKTRAGLILKVQ